MIPKQLPILFAAGAEDPVGGFGKGVRKVYEKYKAAGIQDISLRLYAGDRHELLNETDREQVYEDLLEAKRFREMKKFQFFEKRVKKSRNIMPYMPMWKNIIRKARRTICL